MLTFLAVCWAATLELKVIDRAGEPVPGADLRLSALLDDPIRSRRVTGDLLGHAEVCVVPGVDYALVAQAGDAWAHIPAVFVGRDGGAWVVEVSTEAERAAEVLARRERVSAVGSAGIARWVETQVQMWMGYAVRLRVNEPDMLGYVAVEGRFRRVRRARGYYIGAAPRGLFGYKRRIPRWQPTRLRVSGRLAPAVVEGRWDGELRVVGRRWAEPLRFGHGLPDETIARPAPFRQYVGEGDGCGSWP